MLKPQEQVFFYDLHKKEHEGIVLGSEAEYFWLLVPTLGNVYQGHPDRVENHLDKKVFWVHDRCKTVKSIFDESGHFSSDIFYLAADAEPMKKLLRTYRLLGINGF
jgi:hypothetical protein